MLEIFNNIWVILISCILIFIIIKKIINLYKPFDIEDYILKYQKNDKINENKININDIALFYFGI